MKRLHLWAGLLLLLFSGIVIGWFGHDIFDSPKEPKWEGRSFLTLHDRFMDSFYKMLSLSPEQKKNVDEEVRKTVDEIFEYREKIQPEIDEITDRAIKRIKVYLQDKQASKLDEFHKNIIGIREYVLREIHKFYGYKSGKTDRQQ